MTDLTNILVSVIIPAYNAEEYIEETIKSVLSQTFKNTEIIVVDDGSTDSTFKVAKSFGDKIKLFKQENSGVSRARNLAISKSTGNWIAFIDADDVWLPEKLETQLMLINNRLWSHTNSLYIGENQDGETSRSDLTPQYDGHIFSKLIINNFITTSTVLIEKDLLISFCGFDETQKALEDWKLWLDISLKYPISYCSNILAKYRVYSGSTSRKAREILPIHLDLINHIFESNMIAKDHIRLKNQALSESYQICSYIAEESSDTTFSFYCALKAAQFKFTSFSRWKRLIRTILNLILKK